MKKCILILFFSVFFFSLQAETKIDKQTFVYSVKEGDTLRLDKYDSFVRTEKKPCIIYMFGGGFYSGNRDRADYIPYFNQLVENGYVVVSIDYRLGFRKAKDKLAGNPDIQALASLLGNTVSMAVEDLFDATAFVLSNADDWGVDKNLIVANGSSAGAISVLQAEYEICNKSELARKLPDGFNYAGVMSFAGAIFSMNGDLKWAQKPAPILFFHGDADSNVPYDKIELMTLGFYGSKHICLQLDDLKAPYYFYDIENAAHEIARLPMELNLNEIMTFLDKFVKKKENLAIYSKVRQLDKPEVNKDFEIFDYIKSNFFQSR